MEITSLGHASFRLRTKTVTLVTDPFDSSVVGFAYPKHVSADIVTVSHDHPDHNAVSLIEGSPYVVTGPGEYEIKGVGIIGVRTNHDEVDGKERGMTTMYHIAMDGVQILHLGDLGRKLTKQEIETLDGVDILMIPVGGDVTIDAKTAAEIVAELEPSIVIPMHYKTDKHDAKKFGALKPVEDFLKEMGKTDITPVAKLTMTPDKLPAERTVVVFE